MAESKDYPKMLYRDDAKHGALPVHGKAVFYVVVKDPAEHQALEAKGFRASLKAVAKVEPQPATVETAPTPVPAKAEGRKRK